MKGASRKQHAIINRILTRSFIENKSVNYVLKEKNSPKYISRLMDYSIYMGVHFGEIFINEEETACAIMIDPKLKSFTLGSLIQNLNFVFNISGVLNAKKVLIKEKITGKTFPKTIDFIHLWFLGVEPKEQGNGAGSKLLSEVVEFYKGKKEAVILETSTLRNIHFYEKNGFTIYNKNQNDFGFDFYFFIHEY